VIAEFPKVEGEYDLAKLSEYALSLKRDHPGADDASVLLEPHIEYDHLIQVMDAVRSTTVTKDETEEVTRLALFTNISIGDAP
jgi:hypothetical protein